MVERPAQPVVLLEEEAKTVGLPGIAIPYPLSQLVVEGKLGIYITPATHVGEYYQYYSLGGWG